ncbi:hypothetical protein BOX15_Mlig014718g1 [Macrostomum lignano]|uniref:Uncharacterized protein n=2 Tax=Macrostomum lignano TaxID=282301 RepID=A0A267EPM0_9PLAT|nr:hypothetical protein BOX15_Mlig014718g1 [Macrostomum lignano]
MYSEYKRRLAEEDQFRSGLSDRHMQQKQQKQKTEKNLRRQSQPVLLHQIPSQGRKLVLHFDARNTIFVADLFSRITVEMALNTYISGVVWGVSESDSHWRCISETISIHPPQPGVTSLYKLFEKDIVRVPEDRQLLRETLGNFTEQPHGRKFRPIFEANLAKLRWPYKKIDDRLTVTGRDGSAYHYLLPSFLNLVHALDASGREFCVVVRTFGRDAPHILNALDLLRQGLHPGYDKQLSARINLKPESFDRIGRDEFKYFKSDGSVLRSERAVYEHWNSCTGIMAVVDDFEYWQANQYHYTAAKFLWYDPNDSDHQHVMFDDNIRLHDEDNIINVKVFDGPNWEAARDCRPDETAKLEDSLFVPANLIDSIGDPNYFIDRVSQCEANYSQLL